MVLPGTSSARVIDEVLLVQVKMWDTETGMCLQSYDSHTGNVTACCWLPDGQGFLTGSDDKCAPPCGSLTRVQQNKM